MIITLTMSSLYKVLHPFFFQNLYKSLNFYERKLFLNTEN